MWVVPFEAVSEAGSVEFEAEVAAVIIWTSPAVRV